MIQSDNSYFHIVEGTTVRYTVAPETGAPFLTNRSLQLFCFLCNYTHSPESAMVAFTIIHLTGRARRWEQQNGKDRPPPVLLCFLCGGAAEELWNIPYTLFWVLVCQGGLTSVTTSLISVPGPARVTGTFLHSHYPAQRLSMCTVGMQSIWFPHVW